MHQFLLQTVLLTHIHPYQRNKGRRHHRQQRDQRTGLVAHHLLFPPLHKQDTGIGKHIAKAHIEHDIVHVAESLYLILKQQTQKEADTDRNIGQRMIRRNIRIVPLLIQIILGPVYTLPQTQRHHRHRDQKPRLIHLDLPILRRRQKPRIQRSRYKRNSPDKQLRKNIENPRLQGHFIQGI